MTLIHVNHDQFYCSISIHMKQNQSVAISEVQLDKLPDISNWKCNSCNSPTRYKMRRQSFCGWITIELVWHLCIMYAWVHFVQCPDIGRCVHFIWNRSHRCHGGLIQSRCVYFKCAARRLQAIISSSPAFISNANFIYKCRRQSKWCWKAYCTPQANTLPLSPSLATANESLILM